MNMVTQIAIQLGTVMRIMGIGLTVSSRGIHQFTEIMTSDALVDANELGRIRISVTGLAGDSAEQMRMAQGQRVG